MFIAVIQGILYLLYLVVTALYQSAVNVFTAFCLGFVCQCHANVIPIATETELYWIGELREADGKLNEFLLPFQSQLPDTWCSFPLQEP